VQLTPPAASDSRIPLLSAPVKECPSDGLFAIEKRLLNIEKPQEAQEKR
jgi:hypothetical protein